MKAVKFALGLFVASLACSAAVATEVQAEAQAEAGSPSYIMPAAFPTPYYSQFLPPYQNFNPFYPLPSVSYVGPQRHPFRQWSPYYYYGGPVQWGSGPASAAPNPTSTVASVQAPSTTSFIETTADATEEVDMEAQLRSLLSEGPLHTALVETEATTTITSKAAAEAEAEVESDWATAAMQNARSGHVDADPIGTRRAQAAANRYAKSAQWADKFDNYNNAWTKKQANKRIAEMRGESLIEISADSESEVEAEGAVELAAAVAAEVNALAELDAEAEAEMEAEAEADAEADAEAEAEAEVDAESEAESEAEAEADAEADSEVEVFAEVDADAPSSLLEVSAGAQVEAQAQAAAMAEAEAMVYAQINSAVRAQKEIASLMALKSTMKEEAAQLLEEELERIISQEVNQAFESAKEELVREGKFPKMEFSLLETSNTNQKSTPEARAAFLAAFDKSYTVSLARGSGLV